MKFFQLKHSAGRRHLVLLLTLLGQFAVAGPIGLLSRDDIEYPSGKAPSKDEVELGKILFFDPRLSGNKSQSCATCHDPNLGWGYGVAKGFGSEGNVLPRNSPHVYNLAWMTSFFWDGRADSLEKQILLAIKNPLTMNLPEGEMLKRISNVPYYEGQFKKAYKDGITYENVGKALAGFQRELIVDDTPFDRFMKGNKNAMSPEAVRGMNLFTGKAKCTTCHDGGNFTDGSYHNLGMGDKDIGRGKVDSNMAYRFRTPTIRNVSLTAPYMHDGSLATLEDVIRFYNRGGNVPNRDIKKLGLTDLEIQDLVAFLGALTQWIPFERPLVPN